ncbi:MAG: PqqD family protein [Thermoanaerobaculia bacterium]
MESTIEITANSVFRRSDEVVARQVGAESILVPIRQNVGNLDFVYTLSPVAARVWALIDGKRTVEDVVRIIIDEYDVTRETAVADTSELLNDLAGVSLITLVP